MEMENASKRDLIFLYVAPDIYTHSHTHTTHIMRAQRKRDAH